MPLQDDLHHADLPENQPTMELMDGAAQATSPRRSMMERFLRGAIYCVLLLAASALLAISAVPELAHYTGFFPDTKAGASRSFQTPDGMAMNVATSGGLAGSPKSPFSHAEIKAAICESGGDWCSHKDEVSFSGTQAADADMEYVKWIPRLVTLGVAGTQITDAGLRHITGLTELRRLNASNTGITDAGLRQIIGLISLREFNASHTDITDAGLRQLTVLPKLRSLDLAGTQVTDSAIEILKNMPALRSLDITDTQITEAGLQQMQEITKLKTLHVSTNQFSEAGLEGLTTALPACRIVRD